MPFGLLMCVASLALLAWLLAKRYESWTIGLISAGIVHSCFAVMVVQLLSRMSMLSQLNLCYIWTAFAVGLVLVIWRWRKRLALPQLDNKLLGGAVAFYLLILLSIAVVAPPNTWDSMTYHMSRVMHWIQNGSVASYQTDIPRQVAYSPGAEYNLLNLQLLSGSDVMSNLVQWFAMVICVLSCSRIPRMLGAGSAATWPSSIFCLTLPMGILQATSTQTDYALSAGIVAAVLFALQALAESQPRKNLEYCILGSMSSGLALLTKATAALVLAPLILAFTVCYVRKFGKGSVIPAVVSVGTIAVIISGFYTDNWTDLTGKFFSYAIKIGRDSTATELISPGSVLSNVIRNAALQVATPFASCNSLLTEAVETIHPVTGLSINDPRTTFRNQTFRLAAGREQLHEDCAGYLVHACLAMILLTLYVIRGTDLNNRKLLLYGILVSIGYLLLCIFLKVQPWGTRLFLPVFVLASPIVGAMLASVASGRTSRIVCLSLLLLSLPWLCMNRSRPLLGAHSIIFKSRETNYFRNRPGLEDQYKRVVSLLSKLSPSKILLVSGGDAWEYPLWMLLSRLEKMPRIEAPPGHGWAPQIVNANSDVADSVVVCLESPGSVLKYAKTHRLVLQEPAVAVFVPVTSNTDVPPLQPVSEP